MKTKYNNPRIETIYPIEGRADFFKFAVMDGDSIAVDKEGKEIIFQEKNDAIIVVNARKKANTKLKIKEVQDEADKKIALIEKHYKIDSQLNLGAKLGVFDNFINVATENKDQLKEFLLLFPATSEPIKDEHIKDYDFNYKVGISNSARGESKGELRYQNGDIGRVWVQFPIELISDFTGKNTRGATDSEHVHFMGTRRSDLGKITIRKISFNEPHITYYGGDEALKSASAAEEVINSLLD